MRAVAIASIGLVGLVIVLAVMMLSTGDPVNHEAVGW